MVLLPVTCFLSPSWSLSVFRGVLTLGVPRYHLLYKPPPTMEIQERLLQNPKDSEERVKFKLDLYYRNLAELQEYYPHAISLNGDQDPYTVFEYIESGIIAPLPKKVH